jgi:hypothetical protein
MEETLLIQGWGVFENHTVDGKIAKFTLWRNQDQWPKADKNENNKKRKNNNGLLNICKLSVIHI